MNLIESTEILWANGKGMEFKGTTLTMTECQDKLKRTRIYSANEGCKIIMRSHSEVSLSSSTDENSM